MDRKYSKILKLIDNNKIKQAEKLATKAYKKNSNDYNLANILMYIYHLLKKRDLEEKFALKSMQINPDQEKPYNNLGFIYMRVYQDYDKAKEAFLKAINNAPNSSVGYQNIGTIFFDLRELDKAKCYYEKSYKLNPNENSIYHNLANTYCALRENEKAMQLYEKALRSDPNNPEINSTYSRCLLKNKLYKKGFDLYRYRYHPEKRDKQTHLLSTDKLLTRGDDISGKRVLLSYEQGFGDVLQFSRFVKLFKAKGAIVYLQAKKLLYDLLSYNFPEATVIKDNEIIEYDYHMPIMDSVYFFDLDYNDMPFEYGYITVDSKRSSQIKQQYFNNSLKKIGIVWRTNPAKGESYVKLKERESRNCKLEDFINFFNKKGVQLYSLQVGITNKERKLLDKFNIPSLGDHLVSFYDNALFIDNLDAVIGIDTVSLLLAGSVGKQSAVILSENHDWRWTDSDTHTKWFMTINIYRKERNWETTLQKVANSKIFNIASQKELELADAIRLHQIGDLKRAKKAYEKILEKDGNNTKALHYVALIYYQFGYALEAVEILKNALQIAREDSDIYDDLFSLVKEMKNLTPFAKRYLLFDPKYISDEKFCVKSETYELKDEDIKIIKDIRTSLCGTNRPADDLKLHSVCLYLDLIEFGSCVAIKKFLEYKRSDRAYISLLEKKLYFLLKLVKNVNGFSLNEQDQEEIYFAFEHIFKDEIIKNDYKIAFISTVYNYYMIDRDTKYKKLLTYIAKVFNYALEAKLDTSSMMSLYDMVTFIYWGTGYDINQAKECNDMVIKPFSLYLNNWLKKEKIDSKRKHNNEHKKRICFVASKLVGQNYSVGKILYSLLEVLSKQENSKGFEFFLYIVNEADRDMLEDVKRFGIQVECFPQTDPLQKALEIREKIVENQIETMIVDMPWSVETFLLTSRASSTQIYWSHGWDIYGAKNIDKYISHYEQRYKGYDWKIFQVPISKKFLIGTPQDKEEGEKLKQKYLEKFGEDTIILGTIGRLVKLDSNEYIQVVSKIMKQNPNTIYLACGSGDDKPIKEKIKKYGIDKERFIFTRQVNPHIFGWVIDVWLNTFPLEGGHAVEEFLSKEKFFVFINYDKSISQYEFDVKLVFEDLKSNRYFYDAIEGILAVKYYNNYSKLSYSENIGSIGYFYSFMCKEWLNFLNKISKKYNKKIHLYGIGNKEEFLDYLKSNNFDNIVVKSFDDLFQDGNLSLFIEPILWRKSDFLFHLKQNKFLPFEIIANNLELSDKINLIKNMELDLKDFFDFRGLKIEKNNSEEFILAYIGNKERVNDILFINNLLAMLKNTTNVKILFVLDDINNLKWFKYFELYRDRIEVKKFSKDEIYKINIFVLPVKFHNDYLASKVNKKDILVLPFSFFTTTFFGRTIENYLNDMMSDLLNREKFEFVYKKPIEKEGYFLTMLNTFKKDYSVNIKTVEKLKEVGKIKHTLVDYLVYHIKFLSEDKNYYDAILNLDYRWDIAHKTILRIQNKKLNFAKLLN